MLFLLNYHKNYPKTTYIDKSVIIGYNKYMKVHFSNQGNLRYFEHFAKQLDFSRPDRLEIIFDTNFVSVHPAQLVLVAALAKRVGRKNSIILPKNTKHFCWLESMGLYNLLNVSSSDTRCMRQESAGRFIPITFVKTAQDQSRFISDMVPLLHLNEKDATIIKYMIGELVRNVLEHSLTRNGAVVAARYFAKTNKISLAICDTGIGLWRSLKLWKPRSDKEALRLALMPGISGTTLKEGGSTENAGAGLFFIRSIAKTTRNNFVTFSGDTVYVLKKTRSDQKTPVLQADPLTDNCICNDQISRFEGTLVAVDISLDSTVAFKEMLSMINDAYDLAIRERRQAKFRKPNFI